jgi:UDP:flavonoid glycosyltransferase YjiC (YdhE family)
MPAGLARLDLLLPGCDLLVCHGGDIASGAIASGIPQLTLPGHYEQHLTAIRIEQLGAGLAIRRPSSLVPVLDRLLGDPSFGARARAFAARYPAWSPSEQRRRVLARLEQVLAA